MKLRYIPLTFLGDLERHDALTCLTSNRHSSYDRHLMSSWIDVVSSLHNPREIGGDIVNQGSSLCWRFLSRRYLWVTGSPGSKRKQLRSPPPSKNAPFKRKGIPPESRSRFGKAYRPDDTKFAPPAPPPHTHTVRMAENKEWGRGDNNIPFILFEGISKSILFNSILNVVI